MHFEKNTIHAHSSARSRERLDEFRLAAAGLSRSAGELHRVRDIENYGTSSLSHDRKRANIDDKILIAERSAAFGEKNIFIAGLLYFLHGVAISQGERNCPFFKFTTRPVFPAATSKSVCRERNAGICRTSATSAAGAA